MKRILAFASVAMLLGVVAAYAGDAKTALGFHTTDAPIGIRTWLSPKVALDVGVGFTSSDAKTDAISGVPNSNTEDKISGFNVDAGVPYVFKSWDKVKFIGRPGVSFMSGSDEATAGTTTVKNKTSLFTVTAELEVEVNIADNVSVSASHGIGYGSRTDTPPGTAPKTTTTAFDTFGNGWTMVGFHVYLW